MAVNGYHLGNVDYYWKPLSEEAKREWSIRATEANLQAKKERDIVDSMLDDEATASNHLGSRDGRIFVDIEDVQKHL